MKHITWQTLVAAILLTGGIYGCINGLRDHGVEIFKGLAVAALWWLSFPAILAIGWFIFEKIKGPPKK